MTSAIQLAVLRTVLYADVFHCALTPTEIHHFLISADAVSLREVERAIMALCAPDGPLRQRDGRVCIAQRPQLVALRRAREAASGALMPRAVQYGRWLARLPFIRMVALTGALAVHNAAGSDDDLDYLLVTAPGRVWLARALSIALVRLARLRGDVICPNYVLAETALAQERHDLFIAHELAQMLPLYGEDVYRRMREANGWSSQWLANADAPFRALPLYRPGRLAAAAKRATEVLLSGRLGDALEAWERQRKLRRFAADMQTPHHDARLDGEHVKGHFHDHGHRVLGAYEERLRAFGCVEESVAAD